MYLMSNQIILSSPSVFVLISINPCIAMVNHCAAGFKKNGQNEEAPVVVFFFCSCGIMRWCTANLL